MSEKEREARKKAINDYFDDLTIEELQKLEEFISRRDNLLERLSL